MKKTRAFSKAPRMVAALAVLAGMAGGAVALTAGTAGAATTLSSVTLTISNNAANVKVGTPTPATVTTNSATYTWAFKTVATSYTYTKITFSLPAGASGSSLTPTVYGITGCSAKTAAVASTLVTVTLTGCSATPASTAVEVQVAGLKNGASTTSATSTVTAYSSAAAHGTGTASYQLVSNTTAVTIQVPDTLTFTNNTTAITLTPIPGGAQVTSQGEVLKVKTNALHGYTLAGCVTSAGTITHTTATIGQYAGTTAVATLPLTATNFGAKASVAGTGASLGTHWSSTAYLGYTTTCTATTTHQTIMSGSGPTSTNTLTLTNAARLSATQAAGTYTGTISYEVTPQY